MRKRDYYAVNKLRKCGVMGPGYPSGLAPMRASATAGEETELDCALSSAGRCVV